MTLRENILLEAWKASLAYERHRLQSGQPGVTPEELANAALNMADAFCEAEEKRERKAGQP